VKPIADFFPRVLPHLPGCPDPLAAQLILDTAIQFCEASGAIRQTLDPIKLIPNTGVYEFEPPTQQQVVRIFRAHIDGRDLHLAPLSEYPLLTEQVGQPRVLHTTRTDGLPELVLTPTPDAASTLSLDVALRPTRAATTLADDLFDLWLDAISTGAISAAQRMVGQPFTDMPSAGQRHAEFRSHISRARINALMGQVHSAQRVRSRPFA